MISKREWYAALRRTMKRVALILGGRVHDGGVLLLACVGLSPRRGCDGDNVCRAGGVRDGMIGWICYLVSRLKAAWKELVEAAERQRNYWDGDGQ